MNERSTWREIRERRMSEPGAQDAYDNAKLAYELGVAVRKLREKRGWSQQELAAAANMSQPAIARFEAGGTIPTLPVLNRIAAALGAQLKVSVQAPRGTRGTRGTTTKPIRAPKARPAKEANADAAPAKQRAKAADGRSTSTRTPAAL